MAHVGRLHWPGTQMAPSPLKTPTDDVLTAIADEHDLNFLSMSTSSSLVAQVGDMARHVPGLTAKSVLGSTFAASDCFLGPIELSFVTEVDGDGTPLNTARNVSSVSVANVAPTGSAKTFGMTLGPRALGLHASQRSRWCGSSRSTSPSARMAAARRRSATRPPRSSSPAVTDIMCRWPRIVLCVSPVPPSLPRRCAQVRAGMHSAWNRTWATLVASLRPLGVVLATSATQSSTRFVLPVHRRGVGGRRGSVASEVGAVARRRVRAIGHARPSARIGRMCRLWYLHVVS